MSVNVRGRHVGKDIWKPGERSQLTGSYRCETCGRRGKETVIQTKEGEIFPACPHCSDWDMGWRPLPEGSS